jgi:hypothetical protein
VVLCQGFINLYAKKLTNRFVHLQTNRCIPICMSAFVLQVEPVGEGRAAPTLQRKGGAQESESGWWMMDGGWWMMTKKKTRAL